MSLGSWRAIFVWHEIFVKPLQCCLNFYYELSAYMYIYISVSRTTCTYIFLYPELSTYMYIYISRDREISRTTCTYIFLNIWNALQHAETHCNTNSLHICTYISLYNDMPFISHSYHVAVNFSVLPLQWWLNFFYELSTEFLPRTLRAVAEFLKTQLAPNSAMLNDFKAEFWEFYLPRTLGAVAHQDLRGIRLVEKQKFHKMSVCSDYIYIFFQKVRCAVILCTFEYIWECADFWRFLPGKRATSWQRDAGALRRGCCGNCNTQTANQLRHTATRCNTLQHSGGTAP